MSDADQVLIDATLATLDAAFAEEIDECNGALQRARRRRHIDPAAYEFALGRRQDVDDRYHRAALVALEDDPTPSPGNPAPAGHDRKA